VANSVASLAKNRPPLFRSHPSTSTGPAILRQRQARSPDSTSELIRVQMQPGCFNQIGQLLLIRGTGNRAVIPGCASSHASATRAGVDECAFDTSSSAATTANPQSFTYFCTIAPRAPFPCLACCDTCRSKSPRPGRSRGSHQLILRYHWKKIRLVILALYQVVMRLQRYIACKPVAPACLQCFSQACPAII